MLRLIEVIIGEAPSVRGGGTGRGRVLGRKLAEY